MAESRLSPRVGEASARGRPIPPGAPAILQELEHEAGALPVDELPGALEGVERLAAAYRKRVHVALLAKPSAATPATDRLLTVEEAAARLGVESEWLKRQRLPFARRLGRKTVRYSAMGLDR